MPEKNNPSLPPVPAGFKTVYQGTALPTFYAAEMLRPLIGKSVWVCDSGGRTRSGELSEVPRVREDQREADPVKFVDERPLYLREIVAIAVFEPIK